MGFDKFIFKLMWLVYYILRFNKFILNIDLLINKSCVLNSTKPKAYLHKNKKKEALPQKSNVQFPSQTNML